MRQMPRSFFWIDQQLIRSGVWGRLSIGARLAYVALAASVDRQGLSQWSHTKLMTLAGGSDSAEFEKNLRELEEQILIVVPAPDSLAEIRILSLGDQKSPAVQSSQVSDAGVVTSSGPATVVVHTTVHLRGPGPC